MVLVAPSAGTAETADPIQGMMGLTMAGQMIFFAFFTAGYAMMSILREDEEGTLARLFSTPTKRTSILTGKFVAVFVTVALQGVVLMIAGHFAFGVEWGEPASVTLALIAQVVAAAGLGVLLISFVKTTKQGGPVLGGLLTVMGMLGGLFTANIPGGMPAAFESARKGDPSGLGTYSLEYVTRRPFCFGHARPLRGDRPDRHPHVRRGRAPVQAALCIGRCLAGTCHANGAGSGTWVLWE